MTVVLVCDLGGTHFRAALVDAKGEIFSEHLAVCPTPQGVSDWSEIDPIVWWELLIESATSLSLAEPVLFSSVRAIAICGVTRTQVFLAADGSVLRPAITWNDTRAASETASLHKLLPDDHREASSVNAFHPLARLFWLKRHEPALFDRLAVVLDPKDYLNFRLTGRCVSDPVSLARLVASAQSGPSEQSLFEAIGISTAVLPEMIEPTSQVGFVQAGLLGALKQLAGCPVFCCANDTWTAVVGLGAMQAGMAYNISGTTEVFGVISSRSATAEGLLSVDWSGLHQLGGPGQNGADTASWLATVLGEAADSAAVATLLARLLSQVRDPQPLLFLPYLQGERTPFWDTRLRGAFIGLNRKHCAVDLAWAVLEGVTFLNRLVLERAEAALDVPVREIRFGGGASGNAVWRQLKADICQRPVIAGAAREPGILGAAAVALTGLGHFTDLVAAQSALVRVAHYHAPTETRAEHYNALFALFKQSNAALAPTSRALADMTVDW